MYNEKYAQFYTGTNRKAMHRLFCGLIECLRKDDLASLNTYLSEDCIIDFSTIGHHEGIQNIKKVLSWPGPKVDASRATIWNFVARSHENYGVSNAYVQAVKTVEDKINVYPFFFGSEIFCEYKKIDRNWKISHIRSDLCYAEGNNLFVKGKWQLMDENKYDGHLPMINPELDNPWYKIKEDDETQSDEEAVFELMSKYAYAFDHGDFTFLRTFVTEDFLINGGKEKEKDHPLDPGDYLGHRMVSDFLRDKFHKEARMMHSCRMQKIKIDENKALAIMPRSEEHRLKNKKLNKENLHKMFSTAIHYIYAIKEEGTWKMYKYRIIPSEAECDMKDEDVCFDEYVLGVHV